MPELEPDRREVVQQMLNQEKRLLIADDDRDFRESLGEVFSRRGYETQLAADGAEAVEIVQSHSVAIDLMLLDVHMPKLSGIEALERIRDLSLDALPCVLMSAKLDDSIRNQAKRLRISQMLAKPFTLRDVTSTVEQLLTPPNSL